MNDTRTPEQRIQDIARQRFNDALAAAEAANNRTDAAVCRLVLTLFDKD